jgi:hypothetical protein
MKIICKKTKLRWGVSTNNRTCFIIFDIYNPADLTEAPLINISIKKDNIFPAFEFHFSFIFFSIFFRLNKKEATKYFNDIDDSIYNLLATSPSEMLRLKIREEELSEKLKEPEKYIPDGIYCYNNFSKCPFWDMNKDMPHQNSGYCHYLKEGDWYEDGTMLLWDQVKECDINDDID